MGGLALGSFYNETGESSSIGLFLMPSTKTFSASSFPVILPPLTNL